MTRRELVLLKLQNLTETEVAEAIGALTHHVRARLRYNSLHDRTKSGAHGPKNLGMDAVDYYVGESFRKLFEPDGWDWKFEKFTLSQQLMRIANKLISDKVKAFKAKREKIPDFDERDASEIFELAAIADDNFLEDEDVCAKLVKIAIQLSKDDENLEYFSLRYFEKASYEQISTEMSMSIEQIHVLRKKLVRRLMDYKTELTI